jgi:hypothetical protein
MSNAFVSAINQPVVPNTHTTNGMPAFTTTGDALVNLFYTIGASRNNPEQAVRQFVAAFAEDKLIASKIAFWARDIRGGAGEREVFRKILAYLSKHNPEIVRENLDLVPEFGRWDDLFVIEKGTKARKEAMEMFAIAIQNGNGLACKWAPRKGEEAVELRQTLGLTPKGYRKTIVNGSNTVEQLMCAKDWNSIEFGKLPSVASARYQKAFGRNAQEKYAKYIDALQKGEAKINAAAVYPYDIIKSLKMGNAAVAVEQWKALPNYMGDAKILAMVDVSGSMSCAAGAKMGNVSCLDVALSLGLYCADKLTGPFKDTFLTFSSSPELLHIKGDLREKMDQMNRSKWDMSTNISAAFSTILAHAVRNKVSAEDMPETLVILSDMQFDRCAAFPGSALTNVRKQYQAAGYEMPKIVFWNINATYGNTPCTVNDQGVILVSGFSPALFKQILSAKEFSPYAMMMEVIGQDRYAKVVV